MKFKEIPYERIDKEHAARTLSAITDELKNAESYGAAREAFLKFEKEYGHIDSTITLARIRHSIDTRNRFYDAECSYCNRLAPEVEEYVQDWNRAMLKSPFRKEFEEEYGSLMFVNAEITLGTFSKDIVPLLQEENDLVQEYEKLLAGARVDFNGKSLTIAQMGPWKSNPDDAIRKAAFTAEGGWFKDNQGKLDALYDRLTAIRTEMGRSLGGKDYTGLGYARMLRNCYGKEELKSFRSAVIKHLVPLADKIYRLQAERLGKPYPLSYSDMALSFRSGNPKPQGNASHIVETGKRFYDSLCKESSEFFRTMLDRELMDLLATEGKEGGGYCTMLYDIGLPFIFANFNGTQHDIEVITHEAGHAFEAWLNRSRIPQSYVWPSMEACEVHSMSMEFFGETFAEEFFGSDANKFRFSHLCGAITFIPYGTLVDHFQQEIYENPDMSPAERHACWKRLLGLYMPWLRLDGEIPFYSEGRNWQRQSHIYASPFYYIDYCLAQTVALQFWTLIRKDRKEAWENYMKYSRLGGSLTFTELLKKAGLASPFDENTLKGICRDAADFIENFDMSDIR